MKKSGIVRSLKGPKGSNRLKEKPENVILFEIVHDVDEPIMTVKCIEGGPPCQ